MTPNIASLYLLLARQPDDLTQRRMEQSRQAVKNNEREKGR